jgi:hypothetical protein
MSLSTSNTFYKCSAAYKKQGAPNRCPSLLLILFYTRSAAYKKKGTPDRCLSPLLIRFTWALPCTKTRGSRSEYHSTFHTYSLSMYVKQGTTIYIYIYIYIYIQHKSGITKNHISTILYLNECSLQHTVIRDIITEDWVPRLS